MPRKFCEKCKTRPIVYRLYPVWDGMGVISRTPFAGPRSDPVAVCQRCAEDAIKTNRVFNLRRILSIDLGTKIREGSIYDG